MSSNRVVIVTGASRGIGAATAAAFAKRGDIVFANHPDMDGDVHRNDIERWRNKHGIAPECVIPIAADVGNSAEVGAMFATVAKHSGRLDVLVNNAGISRDHTVAKMTDEEWQAVLGVNLGGTFFCCRSAIALLTDGGRIISISSMAAHTGKLWRGQLLGEQSWKSWRLPKHWRWNWLRVISRSIAICPGFIDTDLTRGMPEQVLQSFVKRIPLKRIGTGQDIANCILFLASKEAAYITGQAISINGGLHMTG